MVVKKGGPEGVGENSGAPSRKYLVWIGGMDENKNKKNNPGSQRMAVRSVHAPMIGLSEAPLAKRGSTTGSGPQ